MHKGTLRYIKRYPDPVSASSAKIPWWVLTHICVVWDGNGIQCCPPFTRKSSQAKKDIDVKNAYNILSNETFDKTISVSKSVNIQNTEEFFSSGKTFCLLRQKNLGKSWPLCCCQKWGLYRRISYTSRHVDLQRRQKTELVKEYVDGLIRIRLYLYLYHPAFFVFFS